MSGSNLQIVELYETGGMIPSEIAEQLGYDELAVKAILLQGSSKYREELTKATENPGPLIHAKQDLDFTSADQLAVKAALVRIATTSEDDNLVLRAAKYVRDDGKGRLDKSKLKSVKISVTQFNIALQQAGSVLNRVRSTSPTIEMPDSERVLLQEASQGHGNT